ncbi:MAG: AsmA family protein [Bryobacterales bacterium]|nr:AsmA family protein [Bryobacterales bacterium]
MAEVLELARVARAFPGNLRGSLAKPVVTPDDTAIAEMKMKNLLPTTGDPTKLSTGVLNSVPGNMSGGAAGTINRVLQGLTGKQPDQQQNQDQNQQQLDQLKSIFGSGKKKKTGQ